MIIKTIYRHHFLLFQSCFLPYPIVVPHLFLKKEEQTEA